MIRIITVTLFLVVASALYFLLTQPNNAVQQPAIVNKNNVSQQSINPKGISNKTVSSKLNQSPQPNKVTASIPQSTKKITQSKINSQQSNQDMSDNSAAQFDNLPLEMQEEIKKLSGRYNKDVEPIEIEPGVFMMPHNKGIRTVPVAVVNDDGTVSTYEY